MNRFVRGILRPEAFHGEGARAPFFEGWYLKLVTGDGRRSLALIPGVFLGTVPDSAHAFLQVVVPGAPRARYERFPASAFSAAGDRFDVRVGPSHFGATGLAVDLDGCRGEVRFGPLAPWPVTWASPGAMGWYAWVPVMQCYHGVVSLGHRLEGSLEFDGTRYDFDGGRGYVEKDWGRGFPRRYVWMQSQTFPEPEVTVTAAVADVPWLGGGFAGFIVGLYRQGRLQPFTTYGGARLVGVERLEDGAAVEVEDARHRLTLMARGGRAVAVHKPDDRSMEGVVQEHLDATLAVRLEAKRGGVVFEAVGTQAAFEAEGDLTGLRGPRLPSRDPP